METKNQKEISIMRCGGKILAGILKKSANIVKPGISTIEIDEYIENYIIKNKAKPSFKNYKGYPYSSCISINDELVHGLPSQKTLNSGDIVSIDIGVYYEGYHTDAAITVPVGIISNEAKKLISITNKSLEEGIKLIRPKTKIGNIQNRIQSIIEESNYSVIRDLSGHGIGKRLQEFPSIPNVGSKGSGMELMEGMTFCLEPMVSMGSHKVITLEDGWTVVTADKSLSAHFEHTIAVTKDGYEVLTAID